MDCLFLLLGPFQILTSSSLFSLLLLPTERLYYGDSVLFRLLTYCVEAVFLSNDDPHNTLYGCLLTEFKLFL